MGEIIPKTVGESLYLSMASLGMAFASNQHDKPTYQKIDYIVRNKNYHGYINGNIQLGSFLNDEKWKMDTSNACCYCGRQSDLTLDHMIPQFSSGKHSADNLVVACRSCNSSKNKTDFLEWMAKRGEFPTLGLLRRYLKLVIHYCIEHKLMDIALEPRTRSKPKQASLFDKFESLTAPEQCDTTIRALPFKIELIPHKFPDPIDLVWWVPAKSESECEDNAKAIRHILGCLKRGRTDIEIKNSLIDAEFRGITAYEFKWLKHLARQMLASPQKNKGGKE